MDKKKIGFIASSGGHWEELMCLKEIANKHDAFFVTETISADDEKKSDSIYYLPQINRKEKFFLLHFLKLFGKAGKIIKTEKPDVIITTGALVSFPFCVVAKLKRKKVIYIESFARVYNKSLTGKLVYKFADLFIVQWETMLKCYPKAKYTGGIF